MLKTLRLLLLISTVLVFPSDFVFAQRSGLLTSAQARRLGLEPVWARGFATGYGGKISGVTVHVSPKNNYRGSTIVDKFGRRTFFSDRDAASLAGSRGGYDPMLRRADLQKAKLNALGLDATAEMTEIPDVTMYVRSDLGLLTALDAESGREKWSTQVGKPGYFGHAVAASDEYVVSTSGSRIYLIEAATGRVLDSIPSRFLPSGTPSIVHDRIYVPTTKGVIDVLSTSDLKKREFTLGSPGRIESNVTTTANTVSWSTTDGEIYVASIGRPGIRYHFQSTDAIAASPVYMDEMLFATSLDGFGYAINEANGRLKWRYSAGAPIEEAPLALDGMVFVNTIDGQMSALDSKTGEAKWAASGVTQMVAVSPARVYCVTNGQGLTALDRETGSVVGTANLGRRANVVVNTGTDRVYLIGRSGTIQCFREPANRWPIARKPVLPAPDEEVDETGEGEEVAVPDPVPSAQQPSGGLASDGLDSADVDTGDLDSDDPFADVAPADGGDAEPADEDADPFGTEDGFGDDSAFGDDSGFDDDGGMGDDEDPFAGL